VSRTSLIVELWMGVSGTPRTICGLEAEISVCPPFHVTSGGECHQLLVLGGSLWLPGGAKSGPANCSVAVWAVLDHPEKGVLA